MKVAARAIDDIEKEIEFIYWGKDDIGVSCGNVDPGDSDSFREMVEKLRTAQLLLESKFTFTFEDLYTLRANDPHFTKVETTKIKEGSKISYPTGYGCSLGYALTNNTHVSSLTLDLFSFFEDNKFSEIFKLPDKMNNQRLASFMKKNKGSALRSYPFKSSGDKLKYKKGELLDRMIGISDGLLQAAAKNNAMAHLGCHGLITPTGFHSLLCTTKSL